MLLNLIFNTYFYNTLGGFFVLVGFLNLYHGEYVLRSIGYVFGVPALLLVGAAVATPDMLKVSREKLYKSVFPVFLFYLWLFFTAIITGSIGFEMTRDLAIYCFFWSVIPYCCGLLLSRKIANIDSRLIFVFFAILLGMSISSASTNWYDIWHGRYRVTAYAEISENSFGVILGVFAMASIIKMHGSRMPDHLRLLSITVATVASIIVVLLSGSMGGTISLYLTLLLFFLASKGVFKRGFFSYRKMFIFLGAIGSTLLMVCMLMTYSRNAAIPYSTGTENIGKYVERISNIANRNFDQVEGVRSFHLSLFLDQFLESPLVGKGFGSRLGLRNDPHNYVVELLGETGIVSLALFLIIIFYPLKNALRVLSDSKERGVVFFLSLMLPVVFFETFFSGSVFIDSQLWFLLGIMPLSLRGSSRPGMTSTDPGVKT